MKALVIEDDPEQAEFLRTGLRDSGYECDAVCDGVRGWEMILGRVYDFAVIDIMLPGVSGLELIRRTRERRISLPIIVLSAMGDVADRIAGLNAGADDYLAKPFAFSELAARIAAIVRRGNPSPVEDVIRHGDLVVNLRSHRVRRGDRYVELTQNEYLLLENLLRHQGRIFSPEIIAESIWGFSAPPGSRAVSTRVYTLRRKLCAEGETDVIENERGFGYVIRPLP